MLDLKALEKALTVIGNVGKGEFTFDVDNIPVTMRVLTADEDMLVQKYAREGGNGGEEGEEDTGAMNLLERFKRMSLAMSIVQIGSINLRNEEFVSTGEVTESGVPIRISRVTAVRKIIDGWTRTATLALFQKYLEMVRRADAAAEKSVQFDTQDLDAEIVRVEKRLTELKEEKAKANSLRDGSGISLQAVGDADKAASDRVRLVSNAAGGQMPPARVLEPEEAQEEAVSEVPVTSSVTRPVAAAPVPPPVAQQVHPGPPRQRVMPVGVVAPPSRPVEAPSRMPANASPIEGTFESMQDSMGDGPDDIAAETARLVAARTQARRASLAAVQGQSGEEPLDVPVGQRRPPHRGALNMGDAVMDAGAGEMRAARVPGSVDLEAVRLPSAPVMGQAVRGQGGRPVINPEQKAGPTNPRFQSGRR